MSGDQAYRTHFTGERPRDHITMKPGDRVRIKGEHPEELGTIDAPGSIFDWRVVLDATPGSGGPTLSAFNEIEMEVEEADHG